MKSIWEWWHISAFWKAQAFEHSPAQVLREREGPGQTETGRERRREREREKKREILRELMR